MLQFALLVVFLLFLINAGMVVVGLFNPAKVLKNVPDPTRGKVALGGSVLGLILLLLFGWLGSLNEGAGGASQKATLTTQAVVETRPGLGISRMNAHAFFTRAGYAMGTAESFNGQERWLGTGDRGIAETLGNSVDLAEVAVTYNLMFADKSIQARDLTEMAALMALAFPNWRERDQWLTGAIKMGGGSVSRDNKIALITPAAIGFALSIRADWAENRF